MTWTRLKERVAALADTPGLLVAQKLLRRFGSVAQLRRVFVPYRPHGRIVELRVDVGGRQLRADVSGGRRLIFPEGRGRIRLGFNDLTLIPAAPAGREGESGPTSSTSSSDDAPSTPSSTPPPDTVSSAR